MRALPKVILEDLEEDDEEVNSPVKPFLNSPLLLPHITTENCSLRNEIHDLHVNTYIPAASPSPSTISNISKYDFSQPRIDDITIKNMIKLSILSEGRSRFGKVFKYLNRMTHTEYAVVRWDVRNLDTMQLKEVLEELEYHTTLRHHCLARVYGYYLKDQVLSIFRMFVPSGTVADKLKRGPLDEETTFKFFKQTLQALQFLHDNDVVHGDIKASNLLITISNNIQLADLSVVYSPTPDKHKRRTLLHCAPELLKNILAWTETTCASDIWAAGCVLVAMVTRFPPFQDYFLSQSTTELHEKLIKAHENESESRLYYKSRTLIPTASRELAELVDATFVKCPSRRPQASQLLKSFFFPAKKQMIPEETVTNMSSNRIVCDSHGELYNDAPVKIRSTSNLESVPILKKEKESISDETVLMSGCVRWYLSRCLIFGSLLFKWIGMVLLASISLALVAGSVFFSIFVIYNGIGIVCQCQLNEGFIVLIALILLPIIILLTTLCCNNSCEKYKQAVEDGRLENCSYVFPQPEDDIVLCGIIVVDGKKERRKPSIRRKMANGESDPTAATNLPKGAFVRDVARIA